MLRTTRQIIALAVLVTLAPTLAVAQDQQAQDALPSIADKTEGMERMEGFFPLYWDRDEGQLWMEIDKFDSELLHLNGNAAQAIEELGSSRLVQYAESIDRVHAVVLPGEPGISDLWGLHNVGQLHDYGELPIDLERPHH